jgi:hypothetical protein
MTSIARCVRCALAATLAAIQEHFYAAGDPRLPFDKAGSFERYHHLVNRGRTDPKILLQVGFGRRPAVQAWINARYWPCWA